MAEAVTRDVLMKRGARARERAMARAGGARISAAQWYPEIEYLEAYGMTQQQIATALRISERRVRQIKEQGHPSGAQLIREIPEPIDRTKLPTNIQEMLPLTIEAYEAFFLEFSPFPAIIPFHREIVEDILNNRNVLINVPPRHAKSTTLMWFVLWLICRNRDEEIIWVSKSANLAIKFCRLIAYHLEYNQKLIAAFGRFAPEAMGEVPWKPSAGQLLVVGRQREANAQFTLEARGSGQAILGAEATVVICDDVTDAKISRSETSRETHMEWLRGEVFSRLMPAPENLEDPYRSASGRAVVLGQRVHLHDTYGELAAMRAVKGPNRGDALWKLIRYPAVLRWPDEDPENPEPLVLWPELWTFEELMVAYDRVGEALFMCMYQQEPLPEGTQWVLQDWLEGCRDSHRAQGEGARPGPDLPIPMTRVVSIDPSPTNWNAMIVANVATTRDNLGIEVLELTRWRGGSRRLIQEIERVMAVYNPEYLIMESSTMTKWFEGEPFFQKLRNRINVIAHTTNQNKADAELGTESLAAEIQRGAIRMPYKDELGQRATKIFEEEAMMYGHGFDYDTIMALWFIKWNYKKLYPRNLKRGGFSVHSNNAPAYIKRARNAKSDQDKIVKEWRRRHGSKQSA